MHRDQTILANVDEWRLDVREPDDVMLFTLPFSDVHFEELDNDLMGSEELPKTEALWSLAQGQTASSQRSGGQR